MHKEILYQNKKIFYRIAGSGKPVILIHGFGEDGEVWSSLLTSSKGGGISDTQLKDKFRFIIPDLPGSGESERIEDMSMEGMAEVIHAIIHEENIGSCPVIGHSMGGYITLALVEKYWNHVSAFGLFHSSAYADTEEKKAARRKGIEFIKQHGAYEFLKTATPNLFSPNSQLQIPNSIEEIIEKGRNFSPPALVSYYEAMMARPDTTEMLRKAAVPVLFIMGKYDNAVPIKDGLEQCHLPPISYIHILENSGHMGMIEESEKSSLALLQYVKDLQLNPVL